MELDVEKGTSGRDPNMALGTSSFYSTTLREGVKNLLFSDMCPQRTG